jgi:hypothetical protein
MRRLKTWYPGKLGEALPWCCTLLLRRIAVRVGCRAWRSFAGRRLNTASPRQDPLDAGGLGLRSPVAYACRASGSSGTSRTSVSTISVTATGCSITSTATVSTTGVTGCFTFRATFFTGARFGLALATVFARAALRALPRLAEFARRSLARLCTFDPFLRLAMIRPGPGWCFRNALMPESRQPHNRVINRSCCERLLLAVALSVNDHHLGPTIPSIPR